jgi:hypothetical protein
VTFPELIPQIGPPPQEPAAMYTGCVNLHTPTVDKSEEWYSRTYKNQYKEVVGRKPFDSDQVNGQSNKE